MQNLRAFVLLAGLESVALEICLDLSFSFKCTINLLCWNFPFFRQAVGENHYILTRKEIENPIMNSLIARP